MPPLHQTVWRHAPSSCKPRPLFRAVWRARNRSWRMYCRGHPKANKLRASDRSSKEVLSIMSDCELMSELEL